MRVEKWRHQWWRHSLGSQRFVYFYKHSSDENIRVRVDQVGKYHEKIGNLYYKDELNHFLCILIEDHGRLYTPKFREKDVTYL